MNKNYCYFVTKNEQFYFILRFIYMEGEFMKKILSIFAFFTLVYFACLPASFAYVAASGSSFDSNNNRPTQISYNSSSVYSVNNHYTRPVITTTRVVYHDTMNVRNKTNSRLNTTPYSPSPRYECYSAYEPRPGRNCNSCYYRRY